MSRCYSVTQRSILGYLQQELTSPEGCQWHHVRDVTSALGPATNVEFQSVQRAIPRLADEGLIDVRVVPMPQWGIGRSQTYVRLRVPEAAGVQA